MMRSAFRISIATITTVGALLASERGFAFEPGATFTVLPGTTLGIAYAYTGPPGLYLYSLGNYGTVSVPRGSAPNIGFGPASLKADVGDEVPALLWTTPWIVFGARYAVLVAEPAAAVDLYGSVPGLGWLNINKGGMRNTIVGPANFSWDLHNGWHVGTGINIAVPDGHIAGINGLSEAGAPYWTLEPTFGVSYLRNGFDLSATFLYDFYTTNTYSHATDGQALLVDLTATKRFGRIEIGPVAYLAIQTTRDRGGNPAAFLATRGAANSCEPVAPGVANDCARATEAGAGGKIGYVFDRGELAVVVTQSALNHGQGGADGWRVWTQFSWKLF